MILSETQINNYHTNGYLIVENLFYEEEIKQLKDGISQIDTTPKPNIIREPNGDIRSVFAPQTICKEFDWLYKQERLVKPSQQLLNTDNIYLYQYKLNNKKAFDGGIWEWHQDFPFWHHDDGVKQPLILSAMLLLQDTDHSHGPLMFVPKSHKDGIVAFQPKNHLTEENIKLENSLNGDLKFTINKTLIKKLVDKNGIVSGTGKIGTVIFFHPNIFHASNANLSPIDRNTAIITYNSTSNLPENRKENNRPTYICARDFNPITPKNETLKALSV